jgi:hypothetical protein
MLVSYTAFLQGNEVTALKYPIQCSLVLVNVGCRQVDDGKWAVLKN